MPASSRLDAALSKFEERAARTEERTAKALELVASLIEREKSERAAEAAKLAAVAQKLEALREAAPREPQRQAAPQVAPRAPVPLQPAAAADEIDVRLSELAKRVDARLRPASQARAHNPGPAERPRLDLRELLSQIARRQSELDAARAAGRRAPPRRRPNGGMAREPPSRPKPPESKGGWRGFGVDVAPAQSAKPAPSTTPPRPRARRSRRCGRKSWR